LERHFIESFLLSWFHFRNLAFNSSNSSVTYRAWSPETKHPPANAPN